MRLLMFNAKTGDVLATSASPERNVYKGYVQRGYVPVAYVEYFKTIEEIEGK